MTPSSEIIDQIIKGKIKDKRDLHKAKVRLTKKYKLIDMPTNPDILASAGEDRQQVLEILRKKPSRTLSGVSTVAVMTPPTRCPHGTCIYCPGGPKVNIPQSYTGHEPSTMRAIRNDYDSFKITKNRIEQLTAIGHPTSKIEAIVQGGTLTAQPQDFQLGFVKGIFDGLNGVVSESLNEAKNLNENSEHRCVGLTIETRPDFCKEKEINSLLDFGCTRVELGVQNPDDRIYELVNRGHTVKDVIDSTKLLKDSAYKVNYHLMPNLPYSSKDRDVEMFKQIFEDPAFKPDMLKIYPTLLVKEEFGQTGLHELYRTGEWIPYTDEEAADVIALGKKYIPKWVRVMRVERDIPTKVIVAGPKHTNLREIALQRAKELGIKCKCIRCREVGMKIAKEKIEVKKENIELLREDYEASGGKEVFLSFEDTFNDALIGFVRLRIPDKPFRPEINEDMALIRELHVYARSLPVGEKPREEWQHRGYGKELMNEAERIAKEKFGKSKMVVISGVGAKEYYYKLGYKKEGPYVSKQL